MMAAGPTVGSGSNEDSHFIARQRHLRLVEARDDAAARHVDLIESARERVESRIEELSPDHPAAWALARAWGSDAVPCGTADMSREDVRLAADVVQMAQAVDEWWTLHHGGLDGEQYPDLEEMVQSVLGVVDPAALADAVKLL